RRRHGEPDGSVATGDGHHRLFRVEGISARRHCARRAVDIMAQQDSRSTDRLGPAERDAALATLRDPEHELDVLVIGGGITGTGAALDAVTRGLSTGM